MGRPGRDPLARASEIPLNWSFQTRRGAELEREVSEVFHAVVRSASQETNTHEMTGEEELV